MKTTVRFAMLTTAMAATALMMACGGGEGNAIAAAKAAIEKKDHKSAIIQLKSSLQQNGSNGEARYLLGRSLLHSGDAAAAVLELNKARELNYSPSLVIPDLIRAMLAQGQFKQVVDDFGKLQMVAPKDSAELATVLAIAYARLGQIDAAETSIASALKAMPLWPEAQLLRAKILAGRGKIDDALSLAQQVVASGQMKADAWLLIGDIQIRAKQDSAAAISAYRQVLTEVPASLLAHLSIIAILIEDRQVEPAKQQFAALKKEMPDHPQTRFVEAQMAFFEKDNDKAKAIVEGLLRVYPNGAGLRQFAGAIDLRRSALLQAEANLAKAVQLNPDLATARRLLAQTYMRMGQADKALKALAPLLSGTDIAAETLALAAEAYLQGGDPQRANALYTQLAKLAPKDPGIRTALALSQLARGNADAAFADLQAISSTDKGSTADLALISARLRRGEFDQALVAIDRLDKKDPSRPVAANLRGRVQLMRRDNAAARASFEQALKLEPTFYSATLSLAGMDLAEQKPDDARKRFEASLAANPKNAHARLQVVELRRRAGAALDELEKLLTEAVAADTSDPQARLALIQHYVERKDAKQVFSAAQAAVAAVPDNVELLDALGKAQLASGDSQQAIRTFSKMGSIQPKEPLSYVRLTDTHAANNDQASASLAIRRGLEVAPDSIDLQRRLIAHARQAKSFTEAQATAKLVQKAHPALAAGYLIEGEIASAQKEWAAAIAAFRVATEKEDRLRHAPPKLHTALVAAGKAADADAFAVGWLKSHPKDASFRVYLGDRAVTANDAVTAEKFYSEAVRLEPRNAHALNNLAWFMAERKQKGAVEMAERAVAQAPGSGVMLDTLARALEVEGALDRALQVQSSAIALAPAGYGMRISLARLYHKVGKKSEALAELDKLAALGAKFSGQTEVARLKKEFGG